MRHSSRTRSVDSIAVSIFVVNFDFEQNLRRAGVSKGRVHKKKTEKVWSFAKPGGGGVSEGSKMPNLYFGKVFFQLACRIILGPPKHVLHLV